MKTFFVLSLPRSGTAWLSNFLTWGDSFCFHEASFGCESLTDLQDTFIRAGTPTVGMADTAALIFAEALDQHFPDSRFLFVVRDLDQVKQSLRNKRFDASSMDMMGQFLGDAIRDENLNSMTVDFEHLFNQNTARVIWNFLRIPGEFPWKRFELLRQIRVDNYARFNSTAPLSRAIARENMHRFGRLLDSIKRGMGEPSQRSQA